MYKILAYLYQCIRGGVEPSAAKAQELSGINPVYYKAVVRDLIKHGYAQVDVRFYAGSTKGLSIAIEAVDYLETDPHMGP